MIHSYLVCVCVVYCGVGNKLKVSWKETRFNFLTQRLFVLWVLFLVSTKTTTKHKPQHTHTHPNTCPPCQCVEFPLKGREGGRVKNFDKRLVPPNTRCIPPCLFASLSPSLRCRIGDDYAPSVGEKGCASFFLFLSCQLCKHFSMWIACFWISAQRRFTIFATTFWWHMWRGVFHFYTHVHIYIYVWVCVINRYPSTLCPYAHLRYV